MRPESSFALTIGTASRAATGTTGHSASPGAGAGAAAGPFRPLVETASGACAWATGPYSTQARARPPEQGRVASGQGVSRLTRRVHGRDRRPCPWSAKSAVHGAAAHGFFCSGRSPPRFCRVLPPRVGRHLLPERGRGAVLGVQLETYVLPPETWTRRSSRMNRASSSHPGAPARYGRHRAPSGARPW